MVDKEAESLCSIRCVRIGVLKANEAARSCSSKYSAGPCWALSLSLPVPVAPAVVEHSNRFYSMRPDVRVCRTEVGL